MPLSTQLPPNEMPLKVTNWWKQTAKKNSKKVTLMKTEATDCILSYSLANSRFDANTDRVGKRFKRGKAKFGRIDGIEIDRQVIACRYQQTRESCKTCERKIICSLQYPLNPDWFLHVLALGAKYPAGRMFIISISFYRSQMTCRIK